MALHDIHIHVRPNGRRPFTEYVDALRRSGDSASANRITRAVRDLEKLGSQDLVRLRKAEKMNDVWQLRSGSHRIFYAWDAGSQKYIILHGFRKRTARAPTRELQRAERLMREYVRSNS